jgi:5-methylcytosine-specific restriction endonuclease McrA
MTFDYEAYLRSPEWRARARQALCRAGYRCQVCGNRGPLDVHHRTYRRVGREWPEDLTVLCHRCHELFHRQAVPS